MTVNQSYTRILKSSRTQYINMSILVKKSFAWIWMAALLTATIGVSVHQIYCYCAGMRTVSLFTVQDECSAKPQTDDAISACCAKKSPAKPSCCKKGAADTEKEPGCTKKTTRIFQLKPEFTVAESDFGKIVHIPSDLPPTPDFVWYAESIITTQSVGIQAFPNPPPPLSGRMICVRHCVAIC